MRILVTGSSGHLGHALVHVLHERGFDVNGLDIVEAPQTSIVGSIADQDLLARQLQDVDIVLHTATLHKPHIVSHSKPDFVDVNIQGTLSLLEASVKAEVKAFVMTSTTSTFGHAMQAASGEPAVWVTEALTPIPKNIYGVTKVAAEDLCQLFAQEHGLPCVVLRTSRFFPEEDDMKHTMPAYEQPNLKANEYLYRRVDIEDVVEAHLLAMEKAETLGFAKYIISATTPFVQEDCEALGQDLPSVIRRLFPMWEALYAHKGWKMFPRLGRVYVNARARHELGWRPRYDFQHVLDALREGEPVRSSLARLVGEKGYHKKKSL